MAFYGFTGGWRGGHRAAISRPMRVRRVCKERPRLGGEAVPEQMPLLDASRSRVGVGPLPMT
jgi:hypothetical protein